MRSGNSGETPTGYNFLDQAADGLAAAAFLSSQPEIRRGGIFLVGHAYGGSAVLRAVSKGLMAPRLFGNYGRLRSYLSAAVAWHPSCPGHLEGVGVPLLVITGSKDRMNSHHACNVMSFDTLPNVPEPEHAIFDGSGHNFDVEWLGEYDPAATQAAYAGIADFLRRPR
jgi:dienelactone hydrolase